MIRTAKNQPARLLLQALESRILLAGDPFILDGIPVITLHDRLTSLQVQPSANTSHAYLNSDEQFSYQEWNQFGVSMFGTPVTWSLDAGSVGTLDSNGLFHSGPSPGAAILRVTAGAITNALTLAVNDIGRPTIADPAAAALVSDRTFNLSVLGADDGGESGLTYTWSTLSAPDDAVVTFSRNGTNAAKNATVSFGRRGDYTLQVSASDGTSASTSTLTVSADQSAHWFLSSATGVDTADGMIADRPVQTVAHLLSLTLEPGDTVLAARNGYWRESLLLPPGVNVAAYGTGELPLFDCSDLIPAAAWTKTPDHSNVYQAANLPVEWLPFGKTNHVNLYENGQQMIQVADEATCDTMPNSYFYDPLVSTNLPLLRIHPSAGGNPATSGITYEYSRRQYAVTTYDSTATAADVWGRRNLHDDGSLSFRGASSGVRATQGSKHNIYLAPGFTHVNMVATDGYAGINIVATLIVINSDNAHNENSTFINPLWTVTTGDFDIYGFTAHPNVSGSYGTLTITGGTLTMPSLALGVGGFAALVMTGVTTLGCNESIGIDLGSQPGEIVITDCHLTGNIRAIDVEGAQDCLIANNVITFPNDFGMGIFSSNLSGALTVTGNTFNGNYGWALYGGSSSHTTIQNNTFTTAGLDYYFMFAGGQPDNSDFNTFLNNTGQRFYINNIDYTYAQYQQLTGQDLHSISSTGSSIPAASPLNATAAAVAIPPRTSTAIPFPPVNPIARAAPAAMPVTRVSSAALPALPSPRAIAPSPAPLTAPPPPPIDAPSKNNAAWISSTSPQAVAAKKRPTHLPLHSNLKPPRPQTMVARRSSLWIYHPLYRPITAQLLDWNPPFAQPKQRLAELTNPPRQPTR